MKLKAHLFPLGDESDELLAASIPENARKIVSARWSVALDDPVLPELLRTGESTNGFWVSAEAVFSAGELREFSHFEVICRKFITESDKDYESNLASCHRSPLMDKGGESPIRLASGFSLTRISLKPNMVGSIGNWIAEYVIGSAVADVLNSKQFTSVSFLPIYTHRDGAPHENFFQIFSNSVLEPVEFDCSIERIQSDEPDENGKLRHLGCLSYRPENLVEKPDFLRSAEPWGGWWGWPSWIVSKRVVDTFRQSKLRGWSFRPVLVADSELHSSYLRQWTHLNELVSQCSLSTFDGGRW